MDKVMLRLNLLIFQPRAFFCPVLCLVSPSSPQILANFILIYVDTIGKIWKLNIDMWQFSLNLTGENWICYIVQTRHFYPSIWGKLCSFDHILTIEIEEQNLSVLRRNKSNFCLVLRFMLESAANASYMERNGVKRSGF